MNIEDHSFGASRNGRIGSLSTRRAMSFAQRLIARVTTLAFVLSTVGCACTPLPPKATPSDDRPSAGSNSAAAQMKAQVSLVHAAARIAALESASDSLAGIELDTSKRVVTVWWKGAVTPALREEIDHQARQADVRIRVQAASYSRMELTRARKALVAKRASSPQVVRVSALKDGSGIEVGITPGSRAPVVTSEVPVRVVAESTIRQTSRLDDSVPWWGGAKAVSSSRQCSTGFAVARYFLWWETSRGILTAGHCAPGGNVPFNDGAGEFIGTAEPPPANPLRDTDSLYITSQAAPRIYDGGVGIGEFSKPVIGSTPLFPGQFVCTSGASTGVHCNIMITSTEETLFPPDGSIIDGVAFGTEQGGAVATGTGDSGGPVFTLAPDTTKVLAAGLMVVGSDTVPCTIAGPDECFKTVGFVYIGYVLDTHAATLLTQ